VRGGLAPVREGVRKVVVEENESLLSAYQGQEEAKRVCREE